MMLTLTPPAAAVLALEQRFPQWWSAPFPRGIADLERDPALIAKLITVPSNGLINPPALPAGAVLQSQQRLDRLSHEPDKNQTSAKWLLTFRSGDSLVPLRVFTKFQSGRGAPLYMQALRAVFERRFLREPAFYRHLAAHVPVRVARPYFADAVSSINRACVILEAVDGATLSDADGCAIGEFRLLIAAAARLNAAFAAKIDAPQTAWIPARSGLEFAEFIELYFGKEPAGWKQLWLALRAYFDARPVTLVHGDCRPGNMIFSGIAAIEPPPAEAAREWAEPAAGAEVVLSDWEAVNIAPLLWDFTYATIIGLRTQDRTAHLDRLLSEHLAALEHHGAGAHTPAPAAARIEVDLLGLVLGYISLSVYEQRLWAQGNALRDVRAWMERAREAVIRVDTDRSATALGVPPAIVRAFQDAIAKRLVFAP
jgi:hypothetical protein